MLKNVQSQHSFLKKKPARGGQILEYFIFSVYRLFEITITLYDSTVNSLQHHTDDFFLRYISLSACFIISETEFSLSLSKTATPPEKSSL